jgi:hypothetical protein
MLCRARPTADQTTELVGSLDWGRGVRRDGIKPWSTQSGVRCNATDSGSGWVMMSFSSRDPHPERRIWGDPSTAGDLKVCAVDAPSDSVDRHRVREEQIGRFVHARQWNGI